MVDIIIRQIEFPGVDLVIKHGYCVGLWTLRCNSECKICNGNVAQTDSYHCVCFSILFNKPFLVFNNHSRGKTRLESLFSILDINSDQCFVKESSDIASNNYSLIEDFAHINKRLDELRVISSDFIQKGLQ